MTGQELIASMALEHAPKSASLLARGDWLPALDKEREHPRRGPTDRSGEAPARGVGRISLETGIQPRCARDQPSLACSNRHCGEAGLPPVVEDQTLQWAAQAQAADMGQ